MCQRHQQFNNSATTNMSHTDPIAEACAAAVSNFKQLTPSKHDVEGSPKPYYLFYETYCANDDGRSGKVNYAVEFATTEMAEWYEFSSYEAWESYVDNLICGEGWHTNNGTEFCGGSPTRPDDIPVLLRVEKDGDNNDDDDDSPGDLKTTVLVTRLKVERCQTR